jgi:hypothetical protein
MSGGDDPDSRPMPSANIDEAWRELPVLGVHKGTIPASVDKSYIASRRIKLSDSSTPHQT